MAKFTEGQPASGAALNSQPVRDNLDALFQQDFKGLRARAQSTPGLTLQVAADQDMAYTHGNTPLNYAGGNSPSLTAPATNPRISVLTIDASGTLAWTNGSEAASPSEPAIPPGKFPICSVYARVGMSSIKNTDDSVNGYILKDRRGLWRFPVILGWLATSGAGAWTIDADYNVTSITDNAGGDFTINWTTAMPSVNYVVLGTAAHDTSGAARIVQQHTARATTTTRCQVLSAAPALADPGLGVNIVAIGG